MMQHALFDAVETPIPPPEDPHRDCDMQALSQMAILYTATEKGNNSGIRFGMSVDDAMAFCESDISRGVLHGTQWAYFWTRLSSFVSCYWIYGEDWLVEFPEPIPSYTEENELTTGDLVACADQDLLPVNPPADPEHTDTTDDIEDPRLPADRLR